MVTWRTRCARACLWRLGDLKDMSCLLFVGWWLCYILETLRCLEDFEYGALDLDWYSEMILVWCLATLGGFDDDLVCYSWRWLLWLMLWRLWRSFIWLSSWWLWYISALVLKDTFRPCLEGLHFSISLGGLYFGIGLLMTWSIEELLFGGFAHSWRLGAWGASLGWTLGGLDDVELVLELIVELGVGGT